MTHAEIIQALGGPAEVARALECHHSQPVRWKDAGIPPRRWREVVDLAAARGLKDITYDKLATSPAALAPAAA